MKIVFTALLTLLILSSCNNAYSTNIETEAQTDKKFIGKWKLINVDGDSRTYPLNKEGINLYKFSGGLSELTYTKKDDNTLVVLVDPESFEIKYNSENDHITLSLPDDKEEVMEFIRVN